MVWDWQAIHSHIYVSVSLNKVLFLYQCIRNKVMHLPKFCTRQFIMLGMVTLCHLEVSVKNTLTQIQKGIKNVSDEFFNSRLFSLHSVGNVFHLSG